MKNIKILFLLLISFITLTSCSFIEEVFAGNFEDSIIEEYKDVTFDVKKQDDKITLYGSDLTANSIEEDFDVHIVYYKNSTLHCLLICQNREYTAKNLELINNFNSQQSRLFAYINFENQLEFHYSHSKLTVNDAIYYTKYFLDKMIFKEDVLNLIKMTKQSEEII